MRAVASRPNGFKAALAGAATWRLFLARDRARLADSLRQIATLKEEIATHISTNAELRRAMEAAKAANEAKTRYLVSVSHEIRSPLNTIYGYAQLLERDDPLPDVEAGAVIRRSAEHLTNLVEGLLEISRIEGGVMRVRSDEVDVRRLLEHVVEMFHMQAASKGLDLQLVIKDPLPDRVRTDEKKLRQILINLVSNAVKYTPEGKVTITLGYRSQVADIEVSDTGIGIAPEDMERVFEPFERGLAAEARGQPGVGLGLSITRVLAQVLGGDINVRSTPAVGSSFRFRVMLPAATTSISYTRSADRITGYRGERRTALVIDDDSSQSIILQSLLRTLGFTVYAAANGSEGIALARQHLDIVLLDIQMPGLNGWEVAERLRAAHGPALKIIMASANAHEFRAGGDGNSHHDAFITKPIDLDALLALIGTQLGLIWERADPTPVETLTQPLQPLPKEAEPFLRHLRHLATVGHVRGIADALVDFATAIPAAEPIVAILKGQLNDLDLRSFSKTLDDA